jgi:hypothetical protein
MHGVLNVDEIKNYLHSFVVLCEMNILSLVSQNLDNFYQIQTKCYKNSDTVFFSPIHRTKRGIRCNAIDSDVVTRQAPARPPFGPTKKCTGINIQEKNNRNRSKTFCACLTVAMDPRLHLHHDVLPLGPGLLLSHAVPRWRASAQTCGTAAASSSPYPPPCPHRPRGLAIISIQSWANTVITTDH